MGIAYWKEGVELTSVLKNMQSIALDPNVWAIYIGCKDGGRAVFKQCVADDSCDWSLGTVEAWANEVDSPPPADVAPNPAPPVPKANVPAKGDNERKNQRDFVQWMITQSTLVKNESELSYRYGKKRELSDGTIAVTVTIARKGAAINNTDFVFHYHPGATGAAVGAPSASKWHFKPYDGAQKHVRLEDSDFSKLDTTMLKTVKNLARGK
jgi:hypothetical protein